MVLKKMQMNNAWHVVTQGNVDREHFHHIHQEDQHATDQKQRQDKPV